jgi:dolichol kinase
MDASLSATQASPRELLQEMYELLVAMDPKIWSTEAADATRATLENLRGRAQGLLKRFEAATPGGHDHRWAGLFRSVVDAIPSAPSAHALPDAAAWNALYVRLAPLYESMATALREQDGATVPRLHPANPLRSLVHVGSGLLAIAAFEHLLTPTSAVALTLAWVVWAWTLEITRRRSAQWNDILMRFFGPIARDHERHRVNSSTWYGTALLIVALTTPDRAGMLGLLALAVGDPAAGIIGRRYGTIRLVAGRSLQGTLAFAASALVASAGYLLLYHPTLGLPAMALLAVTAAGVGALAELCATRIDDNLLVPVAVAWSVALVQLVAGV